MKRQDTFLRPSEREVGAEPIVRNSIRVVCTCALSDYQFIYIYQTPNSDENIIRLFTIDKIYVIVEFCNCA